MRKTFYIFILLLITINAYSYQDKSSYESEPINEASFDDGKWEEVTDGKSFDEERIKPKKKKPATGTPTRSGSSENSFLVGKIGYYILFTLIIAVLGFVIYLLIKQNLGLGNKKVNNITYDVNVLDAETPEDELEKFLNAAADNNDYRVAIRMYYLLIISSLKNQGLITWAKEKTNLDYLFELHQHNYYLPFKNITLNFENVWYGETEIDNTLFESLSLQFKAFLKKITPHDEK